MDVEEVERIEVTGQVGGTIETQVVKPAAPVPGGWMKHPRGHGRVAVVKDGYSVEDIDGPLRGRRMHTFHDLPSLAAWLNRHATDRQRTEIVMNAVMNGADPKGLGNTVAHLTPQEHDGDRVECQIAQVPVWLAWHAILGRDLDQVALAEHVRCYLSSLGGEGNMLLAALRAIKVTAGGSSDLHVGPLGEITLLAGDRKTEASVTIPPELNVRTAIFDGVVDATGAACEYVLRLFVSMRFEGEVEKRPVFRLTCPDLAVVLRKALHDAHADLVARLDKEFLVGFGVPKVDSVPLVETTAPPVAEAASA